MSLYSKKGWDYRTKRSYCNEGTERFSSKQFLLHCLGYVRFCANKETYICESFFDYLHIQGRSTDQTIGHNILLLLQRTG